MQGGQHVGKIVLTWKADDAQADCRQLEDERQPGRQPGAGAGAAPAWAPDCDVVVCPPAAYLAQVQAAGGLRAIALGAQDVSEQAGGAYTGNVSAAMLAEFGVRYVIVGHSERRQYQGESDLLVARKAQQRWPPASRPSCAWARRWPSASRA
jgi:triosephosphate isomerase